MLTYYVHYLYFCILKIPINIEIRGLFVSLSNRRCFLLLNVLRLVLNVNEYEDGI